jgi:hypothetical protein
MIIKKAKYKTVTVKQRKCVSEEVRGCDECKKSIKSQLTKGGLLEITIFRHNRDTESLHFCSWDCTLTHLPKLKSDYFITLPYIYCDEKKGSKSGFDQLIKLISLSKISKK